MLGKLLKHEFKATWKIMLLLNVIVVALGIAGHFILQSAFLSNSSLSPLQAAALILYILSIVAVFLLTTIYLVVRYYKTMYTTEGYLTFTLPVSTSSIVHAKVIAGFIWKLLNSALSIVSILILVSSGLLSMEMQWDDITIAIDEFVKLTGVTPGWIIAIIILSILISSITSIVMLYFCITAGQLWQKHKIVGAILAYAIVYMINQILSMIIMFACSFPQLMSLDSPTPEMIVTLYQKLIAGIFTESIVLCIIFYLGCIFINKKKVNLD